MRMFTFFLLLKFVTQTELIPTKSANIQVNKCRYMKQLPIHVPETEI